MAPDAESPAPFARPPHRVPAAHAFAWYSEAMRLFKRAPARFIALGAVTLAVDLALNLVPVVGGPLSNMIVPLVACGLFYASLAADRDEKPRIAFAIAAFAAPWRAVLAVLLASLVGLAVEVAAGAASGINLLAPAQDTDAMSTGSLFLIYGAGILASLPFTFVPFSALFDGAPVGEAFGASTQAFGRNVPAMLLYALLSVVLLGFGVVTNGAGLLLAVPLWAASSYAAWKDVYAVNSADTDGSST